MKPFSAPGEDTVKRTLGIQAIVETTKRAAKVRK
jgi:hypothetical protein